MAQICYQAQRKQETAMAAKSIRWKREGREKSNPQIYLLTQIHLLVFCPAKIRIRSILHAQINSRMCSSSQPV